MKVLMFGWEFPPYISGGLGTACYGLTKGLINNHIDVTFVLPSRKNQPDNNIIRIIGADDVPLLVQKNLEKIKADPRRRLLSSTALIERLAGATPYYTSTSILKKTQKEIHEMGDFILQSSSRQGGSILNFSGDYGRNLFSEVMAYSLVGECLGYIEDFDVIHAHDWLTFIAGVRAKTVSGKPLILHVHATEFDRSGENINQEVYNIEKYGLDNADRIIAVSHYTKNILISCYGVDPARVEVVHNAVNKHRQLERLGIQKPLTEKIVLFLGRITMQKGPEYFLEAANLVLQKMKDVRFVMAGSGDMLPRMISRMAELNIADKFHFTGFLRGIEVERMYAISDLYVMPSVSEPFGLTPFEALMYDVPLIISRQSGVAEVLRDAALIDFWDTQKLASSIINLLNDEILRETNISRCKEVIQNIEWDNAGLRVKDIYLKTLAA